MWEFIAKLVFGAVVAVVLLSTGALDPLLAQLPPELLKIVDTVIGYSPVINDDPGNQITLENVK